MTPDTHSSARARFLSYLMQGAALSPAPQQRLDRDEALRRHFGAAYFLADTRPGVDVGRFASELLPILLRQLRRTSQHRRTTYQGQVRGRIDWPTTQKARYQKEYNPALYVCRQPQQHNDTPENQLLKYLLLALDELCCSLPPALAAAERWTADGAAAPEWLSLRLQAISHNLRQALSHVRLRHLEAPPAITPRHLLKAGTSKIELYGLVAALYRQYEQVVLRCRWEAIRPILGHTILLPLPADPLGDACIRLAAAGFLETAGARPTLSTRRQDEPEETPLSPDAPGRRR